MGRRVYMFVSNVRMFRAAHWKFKYSLVSSIPGPHSYTKREFKHSACLQAYVVLRPSPTYN